MPKLAWLGGSTMSHPIADKIIAETTGSIVFKSTWEDMPGAMGNSGVGALPTGSRVASISLETYSSGSLNARQRRSPRQTPCPCPCR